MTGYTNGLFPDHNGIIRLYNGTIVYVIDIEYSVDGKTFWEKTYNPNPHYFSGDNQTYLQGHKYMHVKHAGDIHFQAPMYIQAVDGKTSEIRVEGGVIQWGYKDDADSWKDIITIEELKGPEGDSGPEGRGLAIDKACWYGEFINSIPSGAVSGCTSCNSGAATPTNPYLVLSLGDGNHTILQAEIDANKFRSNDGTTWIPLGINDLGRKTRWIADDVNGANYIDYRRTNTEYSSRGKVYAWADNMWTELSNLAVPNYMVAPTVGTPTAGRFMDGYVSATIGLEGGTYNLIVNLDSIGAEHFKPNTFTHGLEEGASIKVAPDEIDGFGLRTYVADSDSEKHLQVNAMDLINDGLAIVTGADVDGALNYTIRVEPDNLINPLSGLFTETQLDGFKDFMVKPADCIEVDLDGVNVVADELTIEADGRAELQVKNTNNAAYGIQRYHVHMNVANTQKGLRKGDGSLSAVAEPLEVKIDPLAMRFNNDGQVDINEDGVQGIHLNVDTCNTLKGIELISDKLEVKLDPANYLEFNGSGEIKIKNTFLTDEVVTSLNGFKGDVEIWASYPAGTGITLNTDNTEVGFVKVNLGVNKLSLQSFLEISGGVAPHTHVAADITDFAAAVEALGYVKLDTIYGDNVKITQTNGLQLKSPGGTWFKLIVTNEAGDLDTQAV